MRKSKKLDKYDLVILIVFFLIALSIWSIPSLSSSSLFGEGDAYWHYGQSDFIVEYDYISPKLPYSYINKYFLKNEIIGPLSREYTPINHINYANVILLGGHKFIPLGIFKAITSFLVFVGLYLLSKYLFSRTVAIIASFGVLFSNRAFSSFLFGQQPTIISFIFIPLILYVTYRIIENILQKQDFKKYLVILVLLLISQFLLHIQGLFISLILITTVSFLFLIKIILKKRLSIIKPIFSKKNLLLYVCLIGLVLITILPFFSIYSGRVANEMGSIEKDYSRIFRWGISPEEVSGAYPSTFVTFKNEYSYFFLPFLLIGILIALIKYKSNNYFFLLGCLLGTYIVLHSELIIGFSIMRVARMLIFEPYIFWIFIAIGISFVISLILSLIKIKNIINYVNLKYFLIIISLIFIYIILGSPIKVSAENVYPSILRVNSDELITADWIKQNLPLNSHIFVKNDHISWRFNKYRFIRTMAHRPAYQSDNISKDVILWNEKYKEANEKYKTDLPLIYYKYLLIDYSDYVRLGPEYQEVINQFKQYENYYFENITPVYKSRTIVIYNITNRVIY